MTSADDQRARSPWVTLWLSPRRTIEQLVATRPTHLVLLLAILGAIAGFYNELISLTGATRLTGWRFWLGYVLLCAVAGIAWLYLSAFILRWIGRLLGGQASALSLRAVLAWSAWPTIVGFIVVVLIGAAVSSTNAQAHGILALLVAVFGLWSYVVFLLMFARVQHFGFWRTIAAGVLNLIVAFVIAVVIRTVLFQPFNVPSHAMSPTLLVGDYFFLSKYAYGYSHYSLPFSPPLFSGRILASEPRRGDVVVFRLPKDDRTDYVKRIVGLPGDRIQMKEGQLYINDAPVKREPLANYSGEGLCGEGTAAVKRWRETLDTGASYETLDCVDNGFNDNTNVYAVPAGHYFMMGDNRDNSSDSRMLSAVGYVPFENIVGRLGLIFFSLDREAADAPAVRSERIGTVVR